MTDPKNKFYVTTPIYYVTAKPHLGSLYSTLLADVVSRWQKLQGKRVFFLTGTDEHGQKIAQAAEKAGESPQKFVDSFIPAYKSMWYEYDISYNYFIRTTDPDHVKAVQYWIKQLEQKGDIYKGFYQGWYCTPDEMFVKEKESEDEKAPLCPNCGRPTILISEETYFFKLSSYQDKLLQFYADNPDFIIPRERAHEVINFVKSGLKDLSISRTTISWGIPFPGDPKHVTYVWADALNNYITAVGYGQPSKEEEFKFWWPADLHILGKDIIRFHAVYWPAFLMAAGLAMPKQLLVHGWIKVDHQKMSKSLGNVVDPQVLYDAYGPEPVRYYLVKNMSMSQDGEFSIADLEQKIASDLANDLGNLLNRAVSLAHKYELFEVKAPAVWSEKSKQLRDSSSNMIREFSAYMADYQFHMALASLWKFIHQVNVYFQESEPWQVGPRDTQAFNEIISATAHALKTIAYMAWPVMPKKMMELLDSLGLPFELEHDMIQKLKEDPWHERFMLKKIPMLFEKPDIKEEPKPEVIAPMLKLEEITLDEFVKCKVVVGTIEDVQEVEGSEKLLKLKVNVGEYGFRQILSGVKKSYSPQDLLGKQGIFIVNLQPRKMMGLESHGMMLFAVHDGRQTLITVPEEVPNGTPVQ